MSVVLPDPTNPTISADITDVPASTADAFRGNINDRLHAVDTKVQLAAGTLQETLKVMGNGAVSGGTITAGIGLSVSIAAFVGVVNSWISTDAATVKGGLTASATNSIYLREDGTFSARTSGTPSTSDGHGAYLLWGVATTSGSAVTAIDNTRAAWGSGLPNPAPGSTWYTGSGVPSSGTGANGDYYLNLDNGDLYQKTSGAWGSPIGSLKGPTGATGAAGTPSIADTTTSGTVKTTAHHADPVVYEVTEMDALLATKAATGGPIDPANLTGPISSAQLPTAAVQTTRTIATSGGLTGGGDLSANRTLAILGAGAATSGQVPTSDGAGSITWATPPGGTPSDASTSAKGIVKLANDLGGTAALPVVTGIQGKAVHTAAPTNGQVLAWVNANSRYEPTTPTTVMAIGNSVTSVTSGSILYGNSSGNLAQDNANLFWNASSHRLGIGTTSPDVSIDSASDIQSRTIIIAGRKSTGNYAQMRDLRAGSGGYAFCIEFFVGGSRKSVVGYDSAVTRFTMTNDTANCSMVLTDGGLFTLGTDPNTPLNNEVVVDQASGLVTIKDAIQATDYNSSAGNPGVTQTVTLAKLTGGGSTGLLTIENGLIVAVTSPT